MSSGTPAGNACATNAVADVMSALAMLLRLRRSAKLSDGHSVAEIWADAPVGSAKTVSGDGEAFRGIARVTEDEGSLVSAEAAGTAATAAAAAHKVAAAAPNLTRASRAMAKPFRSKQSRMFVRKLIPTPGHELSRLQPRRLSGERAFVAGVALLGERSESAPTRIPMKGILCTGRYE